MAYIASRPAHGFDLSGLFARSFGRIKMAAARRAIYMQTLSELRGLSDRDLADLGISRSQFHAIAREAAYRK